MTRKKPEPQKPDLEKAIKALAESIAEVHDRVSALEKAINEQKPKQTWLQWLAGGCANEL